MLCNPICSIVPTYLLKAIARGGNEKESRAALNTLEESKQVVGEREIIGRQVRRANAAYTLLRIVVDAEHGRGTRLVQKRR